MRDITIKPRTTKGERQTLEKKEAEEYIAIQASERHPIVKKYLKSKHFLKYAIKLVVPDFLIGHPNLWDNFKILRKHPQFKPMRMALTAWMIFTITFGAFGIYSFNQAVRVFAVSPVTDTFTDETKIASKTNITVDTGAGQVKLSVSPWACGDAVDFTYNGSPVTYGTVSNVTTGECWLDRNLGATQVAISATDYLAFGDLFQWGRPADGHQLFTWTNATTGSGTNGTQSGQVATITPGTNTFIIFDWPIMDWSSVDSDGALRSAYFAKTDGTGICPSGFRVPTETELNAERLSWSSNNKAGAFASPLKLTRASRRQSSNGLLYPGGPGGMDGYYWASTVYTSYAYALATDDDSGMDMGAAMIATGRGNGSSIRCIKD